MRAAWASAFGSWLARTLLAAVLATACAPAFAQVSGPAANGSGVSGGVLGVRLGGDQSLARVVVDLDRAVSARVVAGDGGATRIMVELTRVEAPENLQGTGQGLVRAWWVQRDGSGARLTIDVVGRGEIRRRFLLPPSDGVAHYRYVIDIAPAGAPTGAIVAPAVAIATSAPIQPAKVAVRPAPRLTASARPSDRRMLYDLAATSQDPPIQAPTPVDATQAAPPVSPPARQRAPRASVIEVSSPGLQATPVATRAGSRAARSTASHKAAALKVVVIDAGHGGHDPGAQSASYNEKDITLATALALRARLERSGRYKVVMTRDTDVFIPLETRVQIARKAKADLFIALHADSAGANPDAHGASVYTLSDSGGTRVHTVLTGNEWFDKTGGKADDPRVSQILLDLTQRDTRNRSAVFAGLLIDQISTRVDLLPRTHRDAGYFVLLAPDVPAVLLEMGFITSPVDQPRLTDPAQQGRLADAISDAIDFYFTGQTRLASR